MFGGLVSLVETRAALLASHGYVTFALAYLYQEDLAQNLFEVELEYIQVTIIYPPIFFYSGDHICSLYEVRVSELKQKLMAEPFK